MFKEALNNGLLVGLVEDDEKSLVLGSWGVLEVFDVLGNDLAVCDEETLALDHVRDHHDLVNYRVWEFQRELGGLNIPGQDYGLGTFETVLYEGEGDDAVFSFDVVPAADSDVQVDCYSDVVGDVEFADVDYVFACVYCCCGFPVGTII